MSRTNTKIIIAQKDGTVVGQYFLGLGEHLIGREDHCTIQCGSTKDAELLAPSALFPQREAFR